MMFCSKLQYFNNLHYNQYLLVKVKLSYINKLILTELHFQEDNSLKIYHFLSKVILYQESIKV